jgi:hypothetical protein
MEGLFIVNATRRERTVQCPLFPLTDPDAAYRPPLMDQAPFPPARIPPTSLRRESACIPANPCIPMMAFSDDLVFAPLATRSAMRRFGDSGSGNNWIPGTSCGGVFQCASGSPWVPWIDSLPSRCLPPARGCRFTPGQPLPIPTQIRLDDSMARESVRGGTRPCP